MLKWIQGGLSAVTGIAEPEYGKDYIHTATDRVKNSKTQPYVELTREDLKWLQPEHTNVETTTFYFSNLNTGIIGFAQIIHSNIISLFTQAQFTFRIFDSNNPEKLNVWTSTKLENFEIKGTDFFADNLSLELNKELNQYHFISNVNKRSKIDIYFDQVVKGCKLGEDPFTYYGDNIEEPWGSMRHIFWPRNKVTGTIQLKRPISLEEKIVTDLKDKVEDEAEERVEEVSDDDDDESNEGDEQSNATNSVEQQENASGVVSYDDADESEYDSECDEEILEDMTIDFTKEENCYGLFVMAMQGMKPNHAAKAWNFVNFHSKEHSVMVMEFITPKSYGCTKVSVGVISNNEKVLAMTIDNDFQHLDQKVDEIGWNVPHKLKIKLSGISSELPDKQIAADDILSKDRVSSTVDVDLKTLVERVDVMAEIPQFVKNIVSGIAGTKPYIYQYADRDNFTLQVNDEKTFEKGIGWTEVTFISESDTVTKESFNEN
ncbi:hypothetical protein TBLA_0H01720 [Henningerozyma blattae CBS 6284]|uniref:Svf1-like C-terminal domain-containing protein n=1 Tax=Henningerozyma blattae (strain ATCC 34711 / CBS 6284 / DSM 70876 / NBRC 10599 / NRRL Y-10934 / UCD 77-7) TaxID=1071380 RepID=I2H7V7_HENB6|nr:hypothetical protein TBLA_0H01720 [Tetrapisispora blattae CBS 6284]CCH62459.1 hypothetical protein TBLA_0H01720 [Tetrapisispora blattae CBS 6284]